MCGNPERLSRQLQAGARFQLADVLFHFCKSALEDGASAARAFESNPIREQGPYRKAKQKRDDQT